MNYMPQRSESFGVSVRYSDSVSQALRYLARSHRDGLFRSMIAEEGDVLRWSRCPAEVFSSFVVADLVSGVAPTEDFIARTLMQAERSQDADGLVHFFQDKSKLVADLDCTAVALSLFLRADLWPRISPVRVLKRILENRSSEGIIEVYAHPAGIHAGRIDACVAANVMHLVYSFEIASKAKETEDFLLKTLDSKSFLNGTRYYPSPDTFLFFVSRIVRDHKEELHPFRDAVRERIVEREGEKGTLLDIAIRTVAASNVNIDLPRCRAVVKAGQNRDGTWPVEPFFRYGRRPIYFGSRALSTAFGLTALAMDVGGAIGKSVVGGQLRRSFI